ncbi:DsrE family protein [Marispirochaeta sp.]|jgi:hypothetical protein|uniref:DsrE family protein n=1 Tax=Marispirochaeta sp. TaxID=2038653 RepID=UPI0029C8533D|nr:DsrE family protein [Marispirochaeta sp.]
MDKELYILWTSADPVTAEKMVFMYAGNSLKNGWWKKVTVIIWGATAELSAKNENIRKGIATLVDQKVQVSACKACADQLGVTELLENLGVEVKYWGEPLTEILQSGKKLISV